MRKMTAREKIEKAYRRLKRLRGKTADTPSTETALAKTLDELAQVLDEWRDVEEDLHRQEHASSVRVEFDSPGMKKPLEPPHQELETARVQTANEKRRLEAVMEALPVGMAITDINGGNVQANAAFEQVWGGPPPPTQSVGDYGAYKAWWVDTGKAVAPSEWASAQVLRKGKPVVGQVCEIQRFDGSRAFVINSAAPVRDADGTVVGSAVAIQDITERIRLEEALKKSRDELEERVRERTAELLRLNAELGLEIVERKKAEAAAHAERQRFNDVMNMLPAYVILIDSDHRVPFANRVFEERFGTSDGRRCFEYLFGRTEPCVRCETFAVLETKMPHHWEWRGPDGRDYDVFDFPFPGSNGQTFVLEMGIDITERKQAEEALKQARDLLEIRVEERTAELAQSVVQLQSEIEERERVSQALLSREESLERLNRTLNALGKSSQVLMRADDESDYLNEVCRIVQEDCGHQMVWIGFAEDNDDKSIRPVAYAGFEEGYLDTLKVTWADTERGRGPTGASIRTGKPHMCCDMATDPKFLPWREQALTRGYASSIALPLMAGGKAFGALTIYSTQACGFSEDEAKLLGELADDLANGITAIRLRTAHREAEQELRRTRDYLEKLIGYANAPIIVWNPNFVITRFNHAFERLTGRPAADVVGQRLSILFPEEERAASMEKIDRTLRGEFWQMIEIPILHASGAVCHVLWNSANILGPDGQGVVATIAQGTDITERKQAEEALQRSTDRFKLLSEVTGQLLASKNPQAIVEDLCLDVMRQLDCDCFFNFLADETSGRLRLNACAGIALEDSLKNEWLDYGVAVCGWVAQAGCRIALEDIQHTDDVRTELVKSYGIQAYACHPLMGRDRVIGTLSFGTRSRRSFREEELDLMKTVADQVAVAMQRIMTEQALRDGEERYRTLFDGMTEGFALHEIVTDESGTPCDYRFLEINHAFQRLTGIERDNVVGRLVTEVLPNNDPYWVSIYGKVALTGEPVHFENYSTPLARWYEVFAYRPAPRRFAVVFMDISERKRADEELATLTEALKRSNTDLEQFAYVTSHDLKEPLRQVSGFVGLLQRDYASLFDQRANEYFDFVKEGATRMQALITDLLEYSRVGRTGTTVSDVDLNAVVHNALRDLQGMLEDTSALITVDDLPRVRGNQTLLTQVFQNLVGNALKFRGQMRPEIQIGVRSENGERVFSVKDNGIGFPRQAAERIFMVFQRLHGRGQFEGTGIGLAICKRAIEHHGGRIWAESDPGEGATFHFTLPAG